MNMENLRFKFRLWCNNKKEWEKDKWHLTPDGRVIDSQRNIEMKKETHFLMQYTGLKDIDNVPIYEGDILKHITNCEQVGVVSFKKSSFYLTLDEQDGCFYLDNCNEVCKIIGNIYEDPELLN